MRSGVIVSTVVTPAASYNLIDIGTLKALLGVTTTDTDAAFAIWIKQASRQAAQFCNQPFVVETIKDQVWPRRDGIPWTVRPDINTLQLSRWPIVALTSVVETIAGTPTTLIAGTDYIADNALGRLYRLDAYGNPKRWSVDPIAVTYSAGWEAVPDDVVAAVADLVKMRYFAQQRDPMVRQENIPGVQEVTYWFGSGPGSSSGIPPNIADQLDNYRMAVIE